MPLGFLWCFQAMHCVAFVENALFKTSGNICWPSLPSSLLDELSMDKRGSNGFFSRWLVCRSSDRSYNPTSSSLVVANCQLHFLPWTFFVCTDLVISRASTFLSIGLNTRTGHTYRILQLWYHKHLGSFPLPLCQLWSLQVISFWQNEAFSHAMSLGY